MRIPSETRPITRFAVVNVTTDTAAFLVLAANKARQSFTVLNRSGVTVYFAYGGNVTASLHVFPLLTGQIYEPPTGACPTAALYAISGSAVADGLCVTEVY